MNGRHIIYCTLIASIRIAAITSRGLPKMWLLLRVGLIILPDGGCIFDSSHFGDLMHHIHIPKVDDMSQAANIETKGR